MAIPLIPEPARDTEPDRDLNRELFSTKPEATVNAPDRDLNSEDLSTKPEDRDREPGRDLKWEAFSAKPEATVQVAVSVVEQERGLELQVNCPEFTLAIMLPIVNVIEAASNLKIEVFSTRLETELSEPLSDLNIEVILAKAEIEFSDPLGP